MVYSVFPLSWDRNTGLLPIQSRHIKTLRRLFITLIHRVGALHARNNGNETVAIADTQIKPTKTRTHRQQPGQSIILPSIQSASVHASDHSPSINTTALSLFARQLRAINFRQASDVRWRTLQCLPYRLYGNAVQSHFHRRYLDPYDTRGADYAVLCKETCKLRRR